MADRNEIAAEIDALTTHCKPPIMSVEQRARWTADWCNDLASFPIEHIRNAFRAWRHGDNARFPTPGQMIPGIRAQSAQRGPASASPQAWAPISDDEYRSLSLNEKIRHHCISASMARRQAGPQLLNGKHCHADEMPERWKALQLRAQNHDAEARRIKAMIGGLEARA